MTIYDHNIEKPKISRDTTEALMRLDKNIDPCKCLEQWNNPKTACIGPYTKEYYARVATQIPKTIAKVQEHVRGIYERLAECNFPKNDENRIRAIIEALAQDGPEYFEKDGEKKVKTNPKATDLILVHLKPGLFKPEYPVVTVNARKIQGDIDYLQRLLALYDRDSDRRRFLKDLIAQLNIYGNSIDQNQMAVAEQRRNRPAEEAFKKMGRATLFIVFAAGALLSGIISIVGKGSPTAAAIYGALAFFMANPGILGPTEERDANRALQAIGAAGLKGCSSKAYAHIVDRLFSDKSIREKVQKYLSERGRTAEYRKTQRQELFTMLKTDVESERILKGLLTDDTALDNFVRGLRNANTKGAQEHVLNYLDPLRMRGDDKLYAKAR